MNIQNSIEKATEYLITQTPKEDPLDAMEGVVCLAARGVLDEDAKVAYKLNLITQARNEHKRSIEEGKATLVEVSKYYRSLGKEKDPHHKAAIIHQKELEGLKLSTLVDALVSLMTNTRLLEQHKFTCLPYDLLYSAYRLINVYHNKCPQEIFDKLSPDNILNNSKYTSRKLFASCKCNAIVSGQRGYMLLLFDGIRLNALLYEHPSLEGLISCSLAASFLTGESWIIEKKSLAKDLLCSQKDNGSWENNIILTSMTLHALGIVGPKGWEEASDRAANWLISLQGDNGAWRTYRDSNAISDTVLVLDALELSQGSKNVSFELPKSMPEAKKHKLSNDLRRETQTTEWLAAQMLEGTPRKTKSKLKEIAKEKFGIGPRGFIRAWEKAITQTGATWMSAPGRRSNKKQ